MKNEEEECWMENSAKYENMLLAMIWFKQLKNLLLFSWFNFCSWWNSFVFVESTNHRKGARAMWIHFNEPEIMEQKRSVKEMGISIKLLKNFPFSYWPQQALDEIQKSNVVRMKRWWHGCQLKEYSKCIIVIEFTTAVIIYGPVGTWVHMDGVS